MSVYGKDCSNPAICEHDVDAWYCRKSCNLPCDVDYDEERCLGWTVCECIKPHEVKANAQLWMKSFCPEFCAVIPDDREPCEWETE
mgnify:CR=1 FL=1